jgi:hypothetical protein
LMYLKIPLRNSGTRSFSLRVTAGDFCEATTSINNKQKSS